MNTSRITQPDENGYPYVAGLAEVLGRPVLFFDLETTGFLDNPRTEILEIGYMQVDQDNNVCYDATLIRNTLPIPPEVIKIHGIDEKLAQTGMDLQDMWSHVEDIFSASILSGFNTREYDIPLLARKVAMSHKDGLDVRDVHITLNDGMRKGRLGEVAQKWNVREVNAHQAMADIVMSAGILEAMIKHKGVEFVAKHYKKVNKTPSFRPR